MLAALALFGWMSVQPTSTWDVPLSCPDADRFQALVEAYLGGELADRAVTFEVHVVVLPAAAGNISLELEIPSPTAETRRHRLTGSDCDALVQQAAAITAINIDPFARPHEAAMIEVWARSEPMPIEVAPPSTPRPREGAPAPSEAKPAPQETAEFGPLIIDDGGSPSPNARARERTVQAYLAASAAANLRLFDGLAPGVHGQLGIEAGRWRAELHGGGAFGRFRSESDPTLGSRLSAWSLGLRGCVVPRWGRVSLRGCVGAGAGQIHARGVGVRDPRSVAQPWMWLAPELGVGVQLGEIVALFVDLGPTISVLRPSFRIDDPIVTFVLPVVAAQGRIGLELRFPRRRA